jgi:hypothetical protein
MRYNYQNRDEATTPLTGRSRFLSFALRTTKLRHLVTITANRCATPLAAMIFGRVVEIKDARAVSAATEMAEAIAVSAVHALARLEVKAGARIRACPSPGLRLQDCGQPSRARARGRDFGSNPVAQPHTVKAVTVMNNVFDCLQIDRGVPADLDKRIAT